MLHIRNTTYLAAYLLSKAPNKTLDRLKLLKLLYLADRASLARTGLSISLDKYVSMDNGPVLSDTYDIIKGTTAPPKIWDALIATDGLNCSLKEYSTEPIRMSKFTELLADQIWAEHGHKSGSELAKFTHTLPEWQDPKGSSVPISIKTILQNFDDFTTEAAEHFDQEHRTLRLELSYFNAS